MQLNCPECGQPITAEHINIQQMAAVCPACHAVFQFEPQIPKTKRRKVKRPKPLALEESPDEVHMAFHTNFRLDKDEDFVGRAILLGVFGFMTGIMLTGSVTEDIPFILPLVFTILTSAMAYLLALTVYNKTHVEMDEDTITVSRKPLFSFAPVREVNLGNVKAIRCEETAASVRENYDTPRFNVYAETLDGRRSIIVNDVIEEYGYFIAQILNERLAQVEHAPVIQENAYTRLEDESALDAAYTISDDGEIVVDDTQTFKGRG